MTVRKVWASSDDGSIEYVSLTKELLAASIKALQQSFYLDETICKAFGLPDHPEAFSEMDELLIRAAKDGVSVVAVHKATGKVAGVALNKLEEHTDIIKFYEDLLKTCKHSASKAVIQWMIDIETKFNVFAQCNVNTVMEIMMAGTVPEFRNRGIAKKLFEVSVDVARSLKQGKNVKVAIDDSQLALGNPPQLVTAILTSYITQKIVKDLNFVCEAKIEFDEFVYDGKSLASIIDTTKIRHITYEYFRL